jgi:hypothetical protein
VAKILFLHHSTGRVVWNGGVPGLMEQRNRMNGTHHTIEESSFPKREPYGWKNYPYDYWNIWVNHAGTMPWQEEPTLEMLAPEYDLVIFKHCFPVSNIEADTGAPDVAASRKSMENYRLQYAALREKLRSFPETRFLVWTPAVQVEAEITSDEARRTREFRDWMIGQWDAPGDNIFVWDFYELETEGGSCLKAGYAAARDDSHPTEEFARTVAPLFVNRILDVLAGRAGDTSLTGRQH